MARGVAKPKKVAPKLQVLESESSSSSDDDTDRDPSYLDKSEKLSSSSSSSSEEDESAASVPAKYLLKDPEKNLKKDSGAGKKSNASKEAKQSSTQKLAKPKKSKSTDPPPAKASTSNELDDSALKKSWWSDEEKVALFTVAHKHRRLLAEHSNKKNAPLKDEVKRRMVGELLNLRSQIQLSERIKHIYNIYIYIYRVSSKIVEGFNTKKTVKIIVHVLRWNQKECYPPYNISCSFSVAVNAVSQSGGRSTDQVLKKFSTFPGKAQVKNDELLRLYVHKGKPIPAGLGLDEAEKLCLKSKPNVREIAGENWTPTANCAKVELPLHWYKYFDLKSLYSICLFQDIFICVPKYL